MYKTTTDLVKAMIRIDPARAFSVAWKMQGGYIHAAIVCDNPVREKRNWNQAGHWGAIAGEALRRMAVNR